MSVAWEHAASQPNDARNEEMENAAEVRLESARAKVGEGKCSRSRQVLFAAVYFINIKQNLYPGIRCEVREKNMI